MFERINKKVKGFFSSQRMKTLALMLLVGTTAAMAQNAAGDYSAGTTALTTVTEENAFWLNHTQTKYDKMNIKLKKTRYKLRIYEYNPNLKLLKQVCNKFDFSGNNCGNHINFVPRNRT
ncbi:hypothetical protein AAH015_10330 [Bacteroides thetaiotaomicron]|uniref:hypothetical protein n=1 Tax=Bacteroides thetaiotaomicron TaxID=818 RepID=UPI0039B37BE7